MQTEGHDYIIIDGELYHHGVKGQRWGVRRFQRKDGSLTPAGKKRVQSKSSGGLKEFGSKVSNKIKGSVAKAKANRQEKKRVEEEEKRVAALKNKSVKDMSDAELKEYISRKTMENQALNLERQIRGMTPETISSGKKFLDGVGKMVVPAVTEAGKSLMKDYLLKVGKEKLGLNEKQVKTGIEKLREEAESVRLKTEMATNKQKQTQVDDWYSNKESYDKMAAAETEFKTSNYITKVMQNKLTQQNVVDTYAKRYETEVNKMINDALKDSDSQANQALSQYTSMLNEKLKKED